MDFIARLAALVPKPRVNLTRFHGVFAPNSKHRALVTPAKRGKGRKKSKMSALTEGEGDSPTADSTVTAHYHGTLRDGTVFDSSVDRGEPLTISLGQVIPCWTEGIALMRVGGKAKLTCPSGIAYGERGQGQIAPNAALTFEVELLDIIG